MKSLYLTTAALAFGAALAGPAAAEWKLTILHSNDFHSRIEPINKYDSTCSGDDITENKCFGGSARMVKAIADEKAKFENVLVLDAGDQFQGSLFYTHYRGKAAAEFMKDAGYEAMAVGNHEFDNGPETLADFAKELPFPLLMANADTSREPAIHDLVKASAVIEKNGQKIGVIGLTPQDNAELTSAGKSIDFTDPVPAVKAEVERLSKDGVDKIILLSHSGYDADQRIAAAVDGLDVIVGGHSHTLLSNSDEHAAGPYPTMVKSPDGTEVPIVQAYAYGKYLGEIEVTFDDAGKVTEAKGDPILLDASRPEDEAVKARVAELAKPLDEIRQKVVGHAAAAIDGSREVCRARECPMGDLVADAMLDHVKGQGASIAIVNGGGLRASIDAGDITMGEVLTVLPFQNTLSTFEIKGDALVEALENGVSQVEDGAGRFPQVAGLKFSWSRSGKPGEYRIRQVEAMEDGAWKPIDPDKTYLVVSNNFMRAGGDGYHVFTDKGEKAYDFGPALEDVVVEYLQKSNEPYEPGTDGRITELN
ncbi:bifunctional metallophosphatase/5'-nucleotidase [Consotaella salsifontis]|uniref:5'-nucleotidase n=1 Tax=Consotaella salsifontis TaxID=1365950 RepID=A0A1T4T907_9HYPH|nr:5'-nucleotidase C-terminal domain-containing protein [Consotaella salsifontis]SKA36847.1 5'-nucleotidase [Consotaella salsifontis]